LTIVEVEAPFRATPRQNDLAKAWHDPAVTRLLASGAIRSGKTQAAARLLVETALTQPSLYLVARATYRELKDSTQRAMLYGDGALPPLIPYEALVGGSLTSGYRASDEQVSFANGAQIIFRSLEENAAEKIRNLSLGGALVDQIEELRYEDGERLYDELLGRLSDPRGPRKLLAVANPAGLTHWLYRRYVQTPDRGTALVHFTMRDNAANLPPGYVDDMEATKETRPGWYRTFVLGEWGAIEDAAYTVEPDHLIGSFRLEDSYSRFEAADYGLNGAPWCLWVVDYEGNLVAYDMLYEKGLLPSQLVPLVRAKQQDWGESQTCWMDPSVWHRVGTVDKLGAPVMLAHEFTQAGVGLSPANNDPRAGMIRVRELLHLDKDHLFPPWHPTKAGQPGAPRMFFTDRVSRLVDEIRSAPLQPLEKRDGGEIVDPEWESRSGHAAAMARYAVMSRPEASERPEPVIDDPRARALRESFEAEERAAEEAELERSLYA